MSFSNEKYEEINLDPVLPSEGKLAQELRNSDSSSSSRSCNSSSNIRTTV